jgi:2-hydroxychromene-2-carboxylate isomerase
VSEAAAAEVLDHGAGAGPASVVPVFFYDLGSFECYLAAEQISSTLPTVAEWVPVLESALHAPRAADEPEPKARAEQVAALGLQPLRWPEHWPTDTERAMLAATYAQQIGRGIAFSLAAFRQGFAGGHDLADDSTILVAGAACEMHPSAVLRALGTRQVREGLDAACRRAREAGVRELPAVALGPLVLTGPAALGEAAAVLARGRDDG